MSYEFPQSDIVSLWQETANARPVFDRVSGTCQFDVAIVGGGYTGLSTARYLARKGLSSIVLEANRIGWGASGRNGGVVAGKFRLSFADMAHRFGIEVARRMHQLGDEAADHIGELVDDYSISCDYRSNGAMRCAHNTLALDNLKRDVQWLKDALGDTSCAIVGPERVFEETGSRGFAGGMLNQHGGTIHPLNFVLGFAQGLKQEGITIAEGEPVLRWRRNGKLVVVETPKAEITVSTVVIATNAYSDLTGATAGVRKSVIPFRSAMIATKPLTGTPAATLLATDRSYSETRRMMRWFRKSGNRLIYGGRGAFGKTDSKSAFEALRTAMIKQFPELDGVDITHRWSGLVAMTLDSIPHVGRLDERTVYAMGYNGSGVATASLMGKYVAELVVGGRPDLGLLTGTPLKPVPFYGLREPAVRLVAGWYQFLDKIGR